ncbi:MAG: hypothetical protein C0469_17400 [Cyanobacteria bacterium DS2.3.42]|nr:hypothetical protein [Cyanobacteria bacterium DS2.3.42]
MQFEDLAGSIKWCLDCEIGVAGWMPASYIRPGDMTAMWQGAAGRSRPRQILKASSRSSKPAPNPQSQHQIRKDPSASEIMES